MKNIVRKIGIQKLLVIMIIIAFVLRVNGLSSTPPSLYWDEVSQAFNAHAILTTGHDEHNEFLPIARYQAFGDYKAPVYIYLDVVAQFIFGKTDFAVRFPSAFLGTLTVALSFYFARELFYSHRKRDVLAFAVAFLLTISPWHIQLSRVAYEGNVATFFTVAGLFFFFYAMRKNAWFYLLSSILFVIGIYAFNAHRIFIPILILLLGVIYFKEILKFKKQVLVSTIAAFILLIPFIIFLQSPESKLRFQEVNIFSDVSVIEEANRLQAADNNSPLSKVIHNRRVLYAKSYLEHYFDFFDPVYIFIKGDVNPRFSTQQTGQLYVFMAPLILVGLYILLKKRNRNYVFIMLWILAAPIAAATARETPHALRSATFIPSFEIVAALGFVAVVGFVKKLKMKYVRKFLIVVMFIIVWVQLIHFNQAYYNDMPRQYSQDWQYGYKQAIEKVEALKDNYDKIVFTDEYGRAYVYVLWYGNYSAVEFWEKGDTRRDIFGFYNTYSFDKYVFEDPKSYVSQANEKVLFVAGKNGLPSGVHVIDSVDFLDGSMGFEIAEN